MFFPFPGTYVRMPDDIRAEIDSLRHAAQVEEIARSRHLARDVGLDAGPVPAPFPRPD
jgi:hypothetical protein